MRRSKKSHCGRVHGASILGVRCNLPEASRRGEARCTSRSEGQATSPQASSLASPAASCSLVHPSQLLQGLSVSPQWWLEVACPPISPWICSERAARGQALRVQLTHSAWSAVLLGFSAPAAREPSKNNKDALDALALLMCLLPQEQWATLCHGLCLCQNGWGLRVCGRKWLSVESVGERKGLVGRFGMSQRLLPESPLATHHKSQKQPKHLKCLRFSSLVFFFFW